ncbi:MULTISPECIES: hypothetical protein [Halocynthiibacter]|uniref:Uncharacterized protein n=1 Tax=Halocynthiibacter halioticoli TaxID=2986804 RepID=A0AAE3LRJ9_9RHOB|nr:MULTISPECIES: hypothetical protein [Halocynthiibacter]MCV6825672.1 hypothetical protein [Halocynthiibacter halioticoli]MCW4058673.1 hypothetical protein [Halocynthiibacter sp. SDUM655004]
MTHPTNFIEIIQQAVAACEAGDARQIRALMQVNDHALQARDERDAAATALRIFADHIESAA